MSIQIVHSYKESTVLISLLAGEAVTPGYTWIFSLLLGFGLHTIVRAGILTVLLGAFCPSWIRKRARPDCFSEFQNQVRFTSGYPRFVPVIGVAAARLISFGGSKPILFNDMCIAVFMTTLCLEVLGDLLAWKVRWPRWGHYYDFEGLDMFDMGHLFAADSEGVHVEHVALGFQGMRSHDGWFAALVMAPASYFSFTLITLLLGAGFVHGVCPDPLPPGLHQLLDGFIWQSPLRCT